MAPKALIFLIFAFVAQFCFASPQNDRRSEISELRSELNALDKRLKRLESNASEEERRNSARDAAAPAGWKDARSWAMIRIGMSRAQVESILGIPVSSKKDSIDYVTLYYQGEVPGAGHVSGNVQLDANDRVAFINPPVF